MLLSCYWINAKMKRKKMLKQLPVERSLMIISEGANTSYHIIKQNYVFSVVSALALACTVQPYTMLPSSHGLSSQCLQGIFILLSVSLGFHMISFIGDILRALIVLTDSLPQLFSICIRINMIEHIVTKRRQDYAFSGDIILLSC